VSARDYLEKPGSLEHEISGFGATDSPALLRIEERGSSIAALRGR